MTGNKLCRQEHGTDMCKSFRCICRSCLHRLDGKERFTEEGHIFGFCGTSDNIIIIPGTLDDSEYRSRDLYCNTHACGYYKDWIKNIIK